MYDTFDIYWQVFSLCVGAPVVAYLAANPILGCLIYSWHYPLTTRKPQSTEEWLSIILLPITSIPYWRFTTQEVRDGHPPIPASWYFGKFVANFNALFLSGIVAYAWIYHTSPAPIDQGPANDWTSLIVQGGLNLFAGGFMLIEALMLLLAFAIAFLLFVALPWWLAAHILLRHHLKQRLL